MDIESLYEGQEIKNYKELCRILNIKDTGGNTKIKNLKTLSQYCQYSKKGNSFIINKIYGSPKIEDSYGNNCIYAKSIDKLIIHMCSITQESVYHYSEFSLNGFLLHLKMINENYKIGRNNLNKFSIYLDVPVETLYDFFNSTTKKNKDILENGLNRLKSKCLIDWYKITKLYLTSGKYKTASDSDLETIKEIEQETLEKLNYKSKRDVFLSGEWNDFSKQVRIRCKELLDCYCYFSVYRIINTNKFRKMLLDELEKESLENDLNDKVIISAINSAEKRHIKTIEEFSNITLKGNFEMPVFDRDKNRMTENYVNDTKKAINICINYPTPIELAECIKEIDKDKYLYLKDMDIIDIDE